MDVLFASLGLDAKEKQIYLKLLSMGACPIGALAKKMGMPRSSLYVVVEKLKGMEVVQVFQNSGKTFVRAAEANALKELLEKKSRRLRNALLELEENASIFEEAQKKGGVAPKVYIYEGVSGIKKIGKIWDTAQDYKCFYDPKSSSREDFIRYVKIKCLKVRGGYVKEIWLDSEEAREYKQMITNPAFEVKLLPNKVQGPLIADIMIFKDRIHMDVMKVADDEETLEVIEVVNDEMTKYMNIFFDELWSRL